MNGPRTRRTSARPNDATTASGRDDRCGAHHGAREIARARPLLGPTLGSAHILLHALRAVKREAPGSVRPHGKAAPMAKREQQSDLLPAGGSRHNERADADDPRFFAALSVILNGRERP